MQIANHNYAWRLQKKGSSGQKLPAPAMQAEIFDTLWTFEDLFVAVTGPERERKRAAKSKRLAERLMSRLISQTIFVISTISISRGERMRALYCLICLIVCEGLGLAAFHVLYDSDVKASIMEREGITAAEVNDQIRSGRRRINYESLQFGEYRKRGAILGLACGVALSIGIIVLGKVKTDGDTPSEDS